MSIAYSKFTIFEAQSKRVMKIYTSYFGNLRKLHQAGIFPVSIARWNPKWFEGTSYKVVAPLPDMLRDNITREQYIRQYRSRVLWNLRPERILQDLQMMTGGRDCALLCYEKPGDFCHRRLLADWMLEQAGLEIPEFGIVKEVPKEPEIIEQTLF